MSQYNQLPITSPRENAPPFSNAPRFNLSSDFINRLSSQGVGREIQNFGQEKLRTMKPWSEFLDKNRFSQPSSIHVGTARLGQNLSHYQTNYLIIALILLTWTFLTNFSLLIVTCVFIASQLVISKLPGGEGPIPIFGGAITATKATYQKILIVIFVPFFWYASAGSALVWLLAMVMVICLGHAVLIEPAATRKEFEEEP